MKLFNTKTLCLVALVSASSMFAMENDNKDSIAKATQVVAAGSGTISEALNGQRFNLGPVSVAGGIVVKVKLNAERADVDIRIGPCIMRRQRIGQRPIARMRGPVSQQQEHVFEIHIHIPVESGRECQTAVVGHYAVTTKIHERCI